MAQTFSRTACVAVRAQDDLRTELSLAYKHPEVSTPHLDALANKSMVFQNAYCQQPICSPSRNSFMSGLTPDHTKAWNFIQYFREARPDAVSLPGAQLSLYTAMLYQRRSFVYTAHADCWPAHPFATRCFRRVLQECGLFSTRRCACVLALQ